MKRSLLLLLSAAVLAAEPVEIRLATILPNGTSGHQRLLEMREAWHRHPAQPVKLSVHAGSADGEHLLVKKMRARQIHAALISAVGLSEIDRSVTCLQLAPLAFQSWQEVDYVRDRIAADLEARLRAKGFEVLFWADAGWVRFFSRAPALQPADFKPMKMFVWTGEPQQLTLLRGLGFQPVGLETEQILPALSTGMIDVVPAPPFLANALQFNRHVGHMVALNWVPIVGAAVVRRDTWDRVPTAVQADLRRTAATTGERIRLRAREEDDAAVVAMQKRGLVVHSPSTTDLVAWHALRAQIYPEIRGRMVPADLFDQVQSHVAEFRAAQPRATP